MDSLAPAVPALSTSSDRASRGRWWPAAAALALLLGTALAGCAGLFEETRYAQAVEAACLDATTLRVVGMANALTPDARVHDYVLLKAVEETLAAGYGHYGHFRVLEQRDSSQILTSRYGVYTVVTDYNGKGDADDENEYIPEETSTTQLPGATLVVRMYKGPKPADAADDVYDAAEVASFVGPCARAI